MDLFVVPTIGFKLLYGFVIVRLHRRDLVWINVTTNPTAEWVARQITEAFPWDGAPRYMIRDRDRIYALAGPGPVTGPTIQKLSEPYGSLLTRMLTPGLMPNIQKPAKSLISLVPAERIELPTFGLQNRYLPDTSLVPI
jgi:hypothetical protein